jgi:hypothetical protein
MTLVWLLPCASAGAAPIYSYAFDQDNYTVPAGGEVDVKVFLVESRTVFFDSLLLIDEGLFSAGVRVRFDNPPGLAQVLHLTDIQGNPAFNDPFSPIKSLVPGSSAGLAENVDLLSHSGVLGTSQGFDTAILFLGTFHFTTDFSNGVTTLRATDFSPLAETITFRTGTVLDPKISDAQASITVFVVPEPAAPLLFLGGGVFGLITLGMRAWRRTKPLRGQNAG